VYRTQFFSLYEAKVGKDSLGIDRLEIGLYTAFLAQKPAQMAHFLEVSDPKTVNRKGNYENTKMVLL
jgi:hypothetical protein